MEKCLPFRRQHFEMHFVNGKAWILNFALYFTEVGSKVFKLHQAIVLNNIN